MSGAPDTPASSGGRGWLGIGARVAAAVMVLGVLLIFGFIVRTELAHDESRCPFVVAGRRTVAPGIRVREEWRACQPEVQERRWVIEREGEPEREFARRRLDAAMFADDAYAWRVTQDAQGKLVLSVENRGTRPIEVLEAKLLDQN